MPETHRVPQPTRQIDTLIIGAGAAGMQAGAFAAARGGSVLVIDHAKAPGEKIRISGGGRCNFTNMHTCLLYTSPSPRDQRGSRMPSSA